MLNLNDIVVFLAAAECNNFSEAGRNLHISQPAVSQKIENLQKHFGTKLFIRQGKSMQLTEAGQALNPMAKELIHVSRWLEETMVSLQGEVVGEMGVGCSTASGKYLLPGLIAGFRRRFPMVRVNVQVSSRDAVIQQLLSGDLALGVSGKKIEHRNLEYEHLYTDDVILIAQKGHRWAEYPRIYTDDLVDEPIILREEAAGTREIVLNDLRQRDIYPEMLNVVMELGNAEAIEMAVEEGIGVAFLSRLAAARGLELGKVVEVQVDGLALKRSIYLVRNHQIVPTRARMAFWDYVISEKNRRLASR